MSEPLPVSALFIARVRRLRKAHGLSAAATAEAISARGYTMKGNLLTSQECGRIRSICVDQAVAAAAAFGITPSELLGPCTRCEGTPPPGFACITCGTTTRKN